MIHKFLIPIFLFLSIIPLLVSVKYFFLKDRPVWPDEAIYTDTAKTINSKGIFATNIFNGAIPGLEKRAYWYPPLYFYVLAGWTRVWGYSIEAVRGLSVFLAVICVALMYTLVYKVSANKWLALLGGLLLSSDLDFGRAARVGRMDILNFLFILSSLLLLVIFEKKKKPVWAFLSGSSSGLAILTHPLGIIPPAVIFLFFIFQKIPLKIKISRLVYFLAPVFILVLLWLISMSDGLALFFEQYRLQIIRKMPIPPWPVTLWKQFFTYRVQFIFYGLIFLGLSVRTSIRRGKYEWLILTGGLISTAMLLWGREMWYTLYFQPFTILAFISLVTLFWENRFTILKGLVLLAVVFYIYLNGKFYLSINDNTGGERYNYHLFTGLLRKSLGGSGSIFLASAPDPYFDLQDDFTLYEIPSVPIPLSSYHRLLDSSDYIIENLGLHSDVLEPYISRNARQVTWVQEPYGYGARVVELVEREKRK